MAAENTKNKKTGSKATSVRTDREKEVPTRKSAAGRSRTNTKSGQQKVQGQSISGKRNTVRKQTEQKTDAHSRHTSANRNSNLNLPDISRPSGTPVFAEILLWIVLAVCIILCLSNLTGIGGPIGRLLSGVFFGVFGVPAYLMPVLLFLMTAFLVANRGKARAWGKVLSALILVLALCCFCELLTGQQEAERTFAEYYARGETLRAGGGVAGGLICRLFLGTFGTVGTWICDLVLFLIGMIALTGKSLFDRLQRDSASAVRQARTRSSMKRELQHQKKKRQRLQKQAGMQEKIDRIRRENEGLQLEIHEPRRSRVISGVSLDTEIDPALPGSGDVHEVIPPLTGGDGDSANRIETKRTRGKWGAGQQTAGKRAVLGSQMQNLSEEEPAEDRRTVGQESAQSAAEESWKVMTNAHRMVESVEKDAEGKQMDLHFTIQRNGSSTPFHTAELQLQEEKPANLQSLEESGQRLIQSLKPGGSGRRQSLEPVQKENGGLSAADGTIPTRAQDTASNAGEEFSQRGRLRQPNSSKAEQKEAMDEVAREIQQHTEAEKPVYHFPPLDLLKRPSGRNSGNSDQEVRETAAKLQQTLESFGVNVKIVNVSCGPAVTRYELMPEQGVKVSRIVNLADDIKLNLAAADIRIEAPIPGKSAVGIEVPNKETSAVYLRELLESSEFQKSKSKLSFAVGKDLAGKAVVTDIAKMPHLLIAGATGSGKSVCINTLIMSILYKAKPEEVKLIMIDPKVVELSVYNGIPHLYIPVVTDPKKASGALNWAVAEMTDRYQKFAETGVRDLKGYNQKIDALEGQDIPDKPKKLPQIVIIVDELADLMMVAPGEVEDAICRLAQLARAAGIHLIIATQRPSVNVITGLIKANMPSRIAFSVTSGVDSRTILDMVGAEKLLGKGDMLFYPQGYAKPVRVQGSFVSDEEVGAVAEFLTQKNDGGAYHQEMQERMTQVTKAVSSLPGAASEESELDSNFTEAGKFIIEKDKASIGMLQRMFKIGFNRAARIMDQLADAGVVGPEEGTKPRKILMSMEEFEEYLRNNGL